MTNGRLLKYTEKDIWNILSEIPDPEIPVITISDLGVLRKIDIKNSTVIVSITPTYSGCPAMEVIEDDIVKALNEKGIKEVKIDLVYSPAWTTDWINNKAREKLRKYGIAPPVRGTEDKGVLFNASNKNIECPLCKSKNTSLISQFGSTACKALYQCKACQEPFDYFKCF